MNAPAQPYRVGPVPRKETYVLDFYTAVCIKAYRQLNSTHVQTVLSTARLAYLPATPRPQIS